MSKPKIEFTYDESGNLYTCIIWWKDEQIQVISSPKNGTTRELQRADEIIQGLIKQNA